MATSQFSMAVHILAMLADRCDERINSSYLAESVNTNAVVIRRILCSLHEAGLVVSQTGYSGGTCLTKQPEEIHLDEVFVAVSRDEVFALHPNSPNKECPVGAGITEVLGEIKEEINKTVTEAFASYTLRDVIEQIEKA
ncbi:MAG: Rrf2 family transcriptional regulator [Pyrinomonadaceae bacterium]